MLSREAQATSRVRVLPAGTLMMLSQLAQLKRAPPLVWRATALLRIIEVRGQLGPPTVRGTLRAALPVKDMDAEGDRQVQTQDRGQDKEPR